MMEVRDRLGPEEQRRHDAQIFQGLSTLVKVGQQHEQLARIPIGLPDAVPKRVWRRKNPKNPESRGLTGPELAELDQESREKAAKAAKKAEKKRQEVQRKEQDETTQGAQWVQEDSQTIALVTQVGRAEVSDIEEVDLTQVDDDNDIYDIDDIQGAIELEETLEFILPPSTAPPTLGGRPKRQRAHTEAFNEARRQGFLPESQPRE
jgi:hypothetical protein